MTIVPLGDKILVQRSSTESVSKGGIVIPDSSQQKPSEGKVMSVGPGRVDEDGKLIPMVLVIGDVVMFPMYAGNEVDESFGTGMLLMREVDVLAKILK